MISEHWKPWMGGKLEQILKAFPFLQVTGCEPMEDGLNFGIAFKFDGWRRGFRLHEDDDAIVAVEKFRKAVIAASHGEYAGAKPERTAEMKRCLDIWAEADPARKAWLG